MFVLKVVVINLLCQRTFASPHMFQKTVESSGLLKSLSKITQEHELISIIWSQRVDNILKDEILQLFKEKVIFVQNNYGTMVGAANEGQINKGPDTILYLASTRADIENGIPWFRDTYHWSVATNLFVFYLSGSEDVGMMLIDPLVKEVFDKLDRNIRIFSEFGKELTMFSHGIRNIKEIEDNVMVAILPQKPYSFHSKDAGFTKGIEIDLVKGLARWSHFNLELEAISELKQTTISYDIIVGARNQVKYGYIKSIDFQFDDLTWCVKRADLYPPWRSFFLVGTWEVWTICAIGIYVTAATLYAFYHHYHHPENFHYCTGLAIMLLFSIPVPYRPTHGIARVHFAFLLLYGLLGMIFFNSFLVTLLTKPPYQHQINTVDELMYVNYKILIDEEIISMHHLGDDNVSSYIKQNFELCRGMEMCIRQLLERPNAATIVPRKYAEYFEYHSDGLPIFCFLSETFNRVTRSLMINQSKRHLLNRINSLIRQAMETGHLLKWERAAVRQEYEDDRNTPVVLTIEHILAAIFIYVVCITVSVLMFVGECLTYKNIQKGDDAGGVWKFLDKYVFSPERIKRKSQLSRNQVPLSRA